MSKTNTTIQNLTIELMGIRAKEKEMNEAAKKDETTIADMRRLNNDFQFKSGKFDGDFRDFLREEGLPENFHLLDVVRHFWEKAKKDIVIAS